MQPLPLPDAYRPRPVAEGSTGVLTAVPETTRTDTGDGGRADTEPGTHATVVFEGLPPLRPSAGPTHRAGAHTRSGNAMGRTRRGLLAGASVAFAEHGLRRSTMQHVATAAGVAKATLYNHFRTKDDVAGALLADELQRLLDLAAAHPRGEALGRLAEEIGGHPVLRRLAAGEPEVLARLLQAPDASLSADLARALGVDTGAAGLVVGWLAGLALRPGTAEERARQAAALERVVG